MKTILYFLFLTLVPAPLVVFICLTIPYWFMFPIWVICRVLSHA